MTSPPEAVHQDSTEDMDNEEKNDEENEHENEKEGQSEQEDIANSVLRILTELLESEVCEQVFNFFNRTLPHIVSPKMALSRKVQQYLVIVSEKSCSTLSLTKS